MLSTSTASWTWPERRRTTSTGPPRRSRRTSSAMPPGNAVAMRRPPPTRPNPPPVWRGNGRAEPPGPGSARGRRDVLVEVEHVVRVVHVFERCQPGELLRRVGAADACGSFVAHRVDIRATGERFERRGAPPCDRHSGLVLGLLGPAGRGDVLEVGAP